MSCRLLQVVGGHTGHTYRLGYRTDISTKWRVDILRFLQQPHDHPQRLDGRRSDRHQKTVGRSHTVGYSTGPVPLRVSIECLQ